MVIWLPAKPSRSRTLAHLLVGRGAHGFRTRCAGALRSCEALEDVDARGQLGGNVLLAAAQDEGAHALGEQLRPARSRPASRWGRASGRGSCAASPRKPGIRKSNWAHSSPRWFSSGVPVRHRRCGACSLRTARGAAAGGVLDRLRFVEDEEVEALGGQGVEVAPDQRVGGEHHVVRRAPSA